MHVSSISTMSYLWILTMILQVLLSENRIVTVKYEPITAMRDVLDANNAHKRNFLPLQDSDVTNEDDEETELQEVVENTNTPCTVVVVSNVQSPNMHTLMRRYRYDKSGVLIPSSVKYYIKRLGANSAPRYVPLSDKAFVPQGGFIRYYKEVPPIPRMW